jgi:23S rRNA (guanosine2251-2'-O)-methyltransferase
MSDRGRPRDRGFGDDRPRRGGSDRPRREFDRPRRDFDGPRGGSDGPRGGADRPRRDSDAPRRDFDRPRRDFDGPRGGFDRPRRDFDRPRRDFDRPREAGTGGPGGFDRPRPRFDRPTERRFDRRGPAGPGPRPGFHQQARPRPAAPPRTDLVGEGEELVAGRRPVAESFAARRDARRLLVVPERRAALESMVLHATTLRLPVIEIEGGTLTSLTGFDGHQGVALVVAERQPATFDDMLARARARDQDPFVLVLDSLEDPQNLGTLLRSAEACGVHGVIYPTRHAAPLTSAAIKASAGASEHLLLAAVDNLPGTLADLRAAGLRLVGADEGSGLRYSEADLRGPLALVVGSEERGISGSLRRRLDMTVRIPMRGRVGSLNAAVAGSVLLFAAAEQRGAPETGDRPPFEDPPLAAEEADSEQAPDPAPADGADAEHQEPAQPDDDQAAEQEPAASADEQGAADHVAEDELLPGGPPSGEAADQP